VGLQKLKDAIGGYGKVMDFKVPGNLKIGTLDSLMTLTESLNKIDAMIAMTLGKVAHTLEDLLGGKPAELDVEGKTANHYVEDFRWSFMKFKTSSSLQAITDAIASDVKKYEADIKKLTSTHHEVCQTLESIDRTDNGSLQVRPLGPIVKNKYEINPSPSLERLFVVVPTKKKDSFLTTYETMEASYKEKRAKKKKEEEDLKIEAQKAEVFKSIPELLGGIEDEKKRAEVLQGGAVYKHIADLLRKSAEVLKAGKLVPAADVKRRKAAGEDIGEHDAKLRLERDMDRMKDLLKDAIEKKLLPYENQAPNTTGAKHAVVDAVLTAEEFKVEKPIVDTCKKLVEKEYKEALMKIQMSELKLSKLSSAESKKQQNPNYIIDPPYIVPGSAEEIKEEEEFCLFSIVIMKKFKDDVLKICRERRFTIRPYKYDAEGERKHHKKKQQLLAEKKKTFNHAQLKCRHLYPEIFIGWMHIKAIRCFAESILRFGLPKRNEDFKMIFPNHIQAALVKVPPARETNVRKILQKLYGGLASEEVTKQLDASETDYSGFGADFYPYVYLQIDLNHS